MGRVFMAGNHAFLLQNSRSIVKGGWEKGTDLLTTQQECSLADQFRQQESLDAFEPPLPIYVYPLESMVEP